MLRRCFGGWQAGRGERGSGLRLVVFSAKERDNVRVCANKAWGDESGNVVT